MNVAELRIARNEAVRSLGEKHKEAVDKAKAIKEEIAVIQSKYDTEIARLQKSCRHSKEHESGSHMICDECGNRRLHLRSWGKPVSWAWNGSNLDAHGIMPSDWGDTWSY